MRGTLVARLDGREGNLEMTDCVECRLRPVTGLTPVIGYDTTASRA